MIRAVRVLYGRTTGVYRRMYGVRVDREVGNVGLRSRTAIVLYRPPVLDDVQGDCVWIYIS